MAQPENDRSKNIGQRRTEPGVAGADGRRENPAQPVDPEKDVVNKGGQIAQDDQQRSGLGSGQS